MIKRIGEWWYALKVCKKYGLKWIPFCKLGDGYYLYNGAVAVNPFDSNFLSIFLHEVGHFVHDRKVGLKEHLKAGKDELRFTSGNIAGQGIYKVLESEAHASRFAAKTGKADRKYLIWAFNTYTKNIFNCMKNPIVVNEFSEIVDCVYKNSRRIEK